MTATIRGAGPAPAIVLMYVQRLPDDSMFQAHVSGGESWRDWFGWGQDRTLAADLFDLGAAIGGATDKSKKPITYPRPTEKKTDKAKAKSVRALWQQIAIKK